MSPLTRSRYKAYLSSPTLPKLPRQLVSRVGYVEDFNEPRTLHGKRRVSARRGRAGEESDFFSTLPSIIVLSLAAISHTLQESYALQSHIHLRDT